MDIKEAIEFIKLKHGNQKRKQGTPYYTHPIAVAELLKNKGFSLEYQLTGLFHDLLEDTECTYQEIINLSNDKVLEAVKLLTKTDGYIMSDYIKNIEKNDIAKMTKLADRIHNLSEATEASYKFQEKYIEETKEWFVSLAKGTVFEKELNKALYNLIKFYEKNKTNSI